MKPETKVVSRQQTASDIGSVRTKVFGNPNLDPDLVAKRIADAEVSNEEAEQEHYTVPDGLRGLEDLIFLGASTKEVTLGTFVFSLATITAKEQEEVFKYSLLLKEAERVLFFKKGVLALSIKKINGRNFSSYLEEDTFQARISVIESMQQSVYDKLFEELDKITTEASALLTAENIKK